MASYRLAVRHDTAANWTSADPILAQGEFGYESDTSELKIGDGSTAWSALGYVAPRSVTSIDDLVDVDTTTVAPVGGDVLKWTGTVWAPTVDDDTEYTDGDVDIHLNYSTATTGQVLSYSGTDYEWIDAGGASLWEDQSAATPTGYLRTGNDIVVGTVNTEPKNLNDEYTGITVGSARGGSINLTSSYGTLRGRMFGSTGGLSLRPGVSGQDVSLQDQSGLDILRAHSADLSVEFGWGTNSYKFPTGRGTADQVLTTNGAGTLSWADAASGGTPGIDDNATTTQLTIEDTGSTFNSDVAITRSHRYGTALEIENTSTGGKAWELRSTGVDSLLGTGDLQFNVDSNSSLTLKADRSAEFSGGLTTYGAFTSPGIDDNATSTAITIDSNENVGIGTASPSTSLDIVRNGVQPLRLESTSGNKVSMRFANTGGGSFIDGIDNNIVIPSGNLGIGETDPQAKLHVKASGPSANMLIESTTSDNGQLVFKNTSAPTGFYTGLSGATGGNAFLYHGDAKDIEFYTAATERMRISAAGTTQVTGGFAAAQPSAGLNAFAAGVNAGLTSQGDYSVAVGANSGATNQGASAVALGRNAGNGTQGSLSVAVGYAAGQTTQGINSVAVGREAGATSQGNQTVAIGRDAGKTTQGANAVAVGVSSGITNQSTDALAIGSYTGQINQGARATAVGPSAGQSDQGADAVSIGYAAGGAGQGASSIAIGNRAGQTNQGANGITINASGVARNYVASNHISLITDDNKYLVYNGTDAWIFAGGDVTVPNDGLKVGRATAGNAQFVVNGEGTTNSTYSLEACNSSGNTRLIVGDAGKTSFYNADNSVGMVFDGTGNLLVGSALAGSVNQTGSQLLDSGVGIFVADNDTPIYLNRRAGSSGYSTLINIFRENVQSGFIGAAQGTTPTFAAPSDERLKDNITDHESELANVMALRPARWDWKDEARGTGEGFIAQEIEQTAWSDLVSEGDDGFKIVAGLGTVETRLIKALQEAVGRIESLEAEVAALKNA